MQTRRTIWVLGVLALRCAIPTHVAAQAGKTGGVAPSPPKTGNPSLTPPSNNLSNSTFDAGRPVFLSGAVIMDDGTLPPEPVLIRRTCGSTTHAEGYTDSRGQFSFELGRRNGAIQDSSSNDSGGDGLRTTTPQNAGGATANNPNGSRGASERDLTGCELQAVLAGFRSEVVNLGLRKSLDNPDVGTLVLHRLGHVDGFTVSVTTSMAPKDARKAFEKAESAIRKQKWEEAIKNLQNAVELYPKFALAWYHLGKVQEARNQFLEARNSFQEALRADTKFVSPYENLTGLLIREQKWEQAVDLSGRMLRMNGIDFPQVWLYNAFANYKLLRFDASEKSVRDGLKIDFDHHVPQLEHLFGILLARKGDYAEAAVHLRWYIAHPTDAVSGDAVKKELAEVERRTAQATAGKTDP